MELDKDAYSLGPSKTALFPFAWGLTPSAAFEFSQMAVHAGANAGVSDPVDVSVSFVVRNTGTARSAATVQLYYSPPIAPRAVMRYPRRLIAFDKLWLGPAESMHGNLSFDLHDGLSRWDERTNAFVVDRGKYKLFVAECNINGVLDDDRGCIQASVDFNVH